VPDLHLRPPQGTWHVVRTHPRQEIRAEQNLESGGIESFLPRMRAVRSRRHSRHVAATPLFPQYIFARFDPAARLHDVSFTRGVQGLVHVGGSLAVVEDAVIAVLRSRVGADGLVRVGEPLQPGEKVIIADGPFAALAGVVERVLPEKERVTLLLTAVHASIRVDLAAESVLRGSGGVWLPARL
jgi:transcriptional antiterminator RfaH